MAMQELALNLKRIIPLWRHRKKNLFNKEFQKKIFGSRLDLQAAGVDAFTPSEQSRSSKCSGYFSGRSNNNGSGKPNNNGSGGSEGDDNGIPQYSQPESVEQTKDRIQRIQEQIVKFEELTDSDSESECEVTAGKITENFQSNAVKRLVKKSLNNAKVKREYAKIKKQLKDGTDPVHIGSKSTKLRGNKVLIKGKHGRYLVETVDDQVNILGIGDRSNKKNMGTFEKLMNDTYDVYLKY